MKVTKSAGCAVGLALWLFAHSLRAEEFDGVEFPAGSSSFADRVVSFDLGDGEDVEAPYDDPATALGPPDYVNNSTPNFLALGNVPADGEPSELVLEFVDNRLIDVEGDDLYVFEVGSIAEPTQVAISSDGDTWFELGRIEGSTRGVDLADHPEVPDGMLFRFVLLRDVPGGGGSGAPYGGPDIDAIGAIGSDVSDADEDGVHDAGDNCRDVENTDQVDADTDAVGDACDVCPAEPGASAGDGCPEGAGGAGGAGGEAAAGAAGAAGEGELAGGSGGVEQGSGGSDASAGGTTPGSSTTTATQTSGAATADDTSGGSDSGGSSPSSTSGNPGDDSGDQTESSASCQCRQQPGRSGFAYSMALALLGVVALQRRRRRSRFA